MSHPLLNVAFYVHGRRSLGPEEDPAAAPLSRFRCQSVQLRHPKCLVFLSNSGGYFEFARSHGRPCNVFALFDAAAIVRVITVDDRWMGARSIVPCDYDTSVVCARFSSERLAVGFGSFSDRRDGGIAVWDMAEVCEHNISFPSSNQSFFPGTEKNHRIPISSSYVGVA